jgi:AcrR family transcriptional regulator
MSSKTVSLLSQDGVAGVTMGDMVDRVGMSTSGLFAHFYALLATA